MKNIFVWIVIFSLFSCGRQAEKTEIDTTDSGVNERIEHKEDAKIITLPDPVWPEYGPGEDGTLFPKDLSALGLEDLTSISQVLDKLSGEVIKKISKININTPTLVDFSGIESFVALEYLELFNVNVKDLKEISLLRNLKGLTIYNAKIDSLDGIGGLHKLYFLGFEGSEIKDHKSIASSDNVTILILDNFKEYRELLRYMPDTVEHLQLESNGIKSLSELEFLHERKSLKRLLIKDNLISMEELLANCKWQDDFSGWPRWRNLEVAWFEM
jgi:Leucine-rich repeat (LRR) protein